MYGGNLYAGLKKFEKGTCVYTCFLAKIIARFNFQIILSVDDKWKAKKLLNSRLPR